VLGSARGVRGSAFITGGGAASSPVNDARSSESSSKIPPPWPSAAGGFTGGYFASKGDPFWTLSGGLAGVITVSAGADVYAPSLDYLLSIFGGGTAVYVGNFIERKMRVDDAVGAVAVHGYSGFLGIVMVGLFATGYPTGINNVPSSFGGQMMGLMTFLPLGFFGGFFIGDYIGNAASLSVIHPIWSDSRGLGSAVPNQDAVTARVTASSDLAGR
jgi:ammonia channel protein AmtB